MTAPVPITPLDSWIKETIGLEPADILTREHLIRYQRRKLLETVQHAAANSPFYRERLASPSRDIHDPASLPFTTADDLCDHSLEFLCGSQSDIARVVTVQTWEPKPKRIHFSDADLESTVDFFHHGMSGIVEPGQSVLILMPGERPGSVGDLLVKALSRMDVRGIVHGLVHDPARTAEAIRAERADCLIGIPTQVLSLVRSKEGGSLPDGLIKSVLLSSDHVPQAIVDEVANTWTCPVFEHYGMTETGFGGGVQCGAHAGYHLREADLFFEIIDPNTGRAVPEGETGEVVVTTLTRRAMPLIRYRTGDLARFLPEPCPCGTALKRLGRIQGHLKAVVTLGKGQDLSITDLDDALFSIPYVTDFEAVLQAQTGIPRLQVAIHAAAPAPENLSTTARNALRAIPAIQESEHAGSLILDPVTVLPPAAASPAPRKRTIHVEHV